MGALAKWDVEAPLASTIDVSNLNPQRAIAMWEGARRISATVEVANMLRHPMGSGVDPAAPIQYADGLSVSVWDQGRTEDLWNFFQTAPIGWQTRQNIQPATEVPIKIPFSEAELVLWNLRQCEENWDGEGSAAADHGSILQAILFLQTFRGIELEWIPSLHADGRALLEAHTEVGRAYMQFSHESNFIAFAALHGEMPATVLLNLADGPCMKDLRDILQRLTVLG